MTLRELTDPRFYASLIADFDFGWSGVHASPLAREEHAEMPDPDDGFEETRPCPWYVTVTTDDSSSALN